MKLISCLLACLFACLSTTAFAQPSLGVSVPELIDEPITIEVPNGTCNNEAIANIQQALSCLDGAVISSSPNVKVTIEVTENATSYDSIVVRHPNAGQIDIVGNCGASACKLTFKPGQNGVVIENGVRLGQLSGFELIGQGNSVTEQGKGVGIYLNNNAQIQAQDIAVSQFYSGVSVNKNSTALFSRLTSTKNTYLGVDIEQSYVDVSNSDIYGNSTGVHVRHAGTVIANNARVHDNQNNGFSINYSSSIQASNLTTYGNSASEEGKWAGVSLYWGSGGQLLFPNIFDHTAVINSTLTFGAVTPICSYYTADTNGASKFCPDIPHTHQ